MEVAPPEKKSWCSCKLLNPLYFQWKIIIAIRKDQDFFFLNKISNY